MNTATTLFIQGLVLCGCTPAYMSDYCEKQDGSELRQYCRNGCCGNTSTVLPCCDDTDGTSSSLPPFSIFFYALTIFILFLLIVCCVGRFARLKQRYAQASSGQPRTLPFSSQDSSQRAPHSIIRSRSLMIATIDNLILVGRQSISSNCSPVEPREITDLPLAPPSYDDAVKTAPPELPPPYTAVENDVVISPPTDSLPGTHMT